jgi:F-type H+-transporting ATPase subunit c
MEYYVKAAAFLGAAIAIGLGTLGPSLGMGMIASKACENIGKYPESANQIRSAMMFGLIMVETAAVYAFVIAFLTILFNR